MDEQLGSAEALDAWMRVLDELAGQLAVLRDATSDGTRLLELSAVEWQPPVGIGALPLDLAGRAASILEDMEALKPVLGKHRDDAARQLRAVEAIPRDAETASVYLDSIG